MEWGALWYWLLGQALNISSKESAEFQRYDTLEHTGFDSRLFHSDWHKKPMSSHNNTTNKFYFCILTTVN